MKTKLHTKQQAEFLLFFLKKTITEKCTLIGSFGRGTESSDHDIDVLLPLEFYFKKGLKTKLKSLLNATEVVDTDWGGWYYSDTYFGDVDIFFTINDFDY